MFAKIKFSYFALLFAGVLLWLAGWMMHAYSVSKPMTDGAIETAPIPMKRESVSLKEGVNVASLHKQMLEVLYADSLPTSYDDQFVSLQSLGAQKQFSGRDRLKFDMLTRSLADRDAVSLYAWAESNKVLRVPYREAIMDQALRSMAIREPLAAFKRVKEMNSYWHRQRAYQAVFSEIIMEHSSDRVLDLVLDADLSIFEQVRYEDIAALIAKDQPDRVFEMIDTRFPTMHRDNARLGALVAIAEEDFGRAEAIAAGMAGDQLALKAQQVLLLQAIRDGDLKKADELFAQSGPSPEKDKALMTLVYDPRGTAIAETIKFIEKHASVGEGGRMVRELYAQSVVDAPETIGAVLELGIDSEDRQQFFNSLAWRVRDADAFEQTYAALETSEFRSEFLNQYLSSTSYSEPREAAELFLRMQDEISHTHSVHQIATSLAQYGAAESLAFAAKIKDESQQKKALEGVVDEWFGQDPSAAWNWLVEQQAANPDDLKFNQELQRRAIGALGKNDALGAIEYVDAIEDPDFQASVRQGVLPSLFQEDAERAIAYIEEVTDPSALDKTYQSVVKGLSYSNPDLALVAALRIEDPNESTKLSQQILKGWSSRRSSSYVLEKIDKLDLTDEQKTTLLEML